MLKCVLLFLASPCYHIVVLHRKIQRKKEIVKKKHVSNRRRTITEKQRLSEKTKQGN